MIAKDIYSKWVCGNLLITSDSKVYLSNGKEAKEIYCGGSLGYYVNRKFRAKSWIRKNIKLEKIYIKTEIEVPF
jgi:hypothetical protein